MADDQTTKIPPYVAYSTFTTFLGGLRDHIPARIDRSVMSRMSGAQQSAIMAALRYFDLVGPDGAPTDALRELVEADDNEYAVQLKSLLEKHYAFLGKDLERATGSQVAERFRQSGIGGSTVAKAMGFYIAAAKIAGIKLSPHIKPPPVPRPSPSRRTRPSREEFDEENGDDLTQPASAKTLLEMLVEKFPSFDPTWEPDVKKKWFEAFDELMKHGKGATG